MQVFDLSITLKCNRPSATRRLARHSTSFARGRRGFLFSLWGWGGRLACHRLGPPFVCQYVKDRGDMDSAGEADVCRGLSGGGPAQESCSCCKVRSFCQPSRAIRCDWMRLGEITWDNGWRGWNETQGDARRRKYPSVEVSSKWLGPARKRAITERASERRTFPGRALEKRRAFQLFQLFQYSN